MPTARMNARRIIATPPSQFPVIVQITDSSLKTVTSRYLERPLRVRHQPQPFAVLSLEQIFAGV